MKYYYRYPPLSEKTRQNGLFVIGGGFTQIPPQTSYPPVRHPDDHHFHWQAGRTLREYQLVYLVRGEGLFESQSAGRRRLTAGTVFALFPGEWHRYSPKFEIGWDEYWVAFDGSIAAEIVDRSSLTRANPAQCTGVDITLKDEFLRVTEELRTEQIGYQGIVAGRVTTILALASALSQRLGYEDAGKIFLIEEAKNVMMNSIDRNIDLEDLASQLNVGYSLFRKVFRQYTGFAPAQYHLELRMNQAIKLLSSSNLPVGEVGRAIGMDSPGYFSFLFKKKTGYSPRDFRHLSRSRSKL